MYIRRQCAERQLVEMCSVPALMGARRGYVVSPGYPRRYPAVTDSAFGSALATALATATEGADRNNCSLTVVVPSTAVVRIRVLDMFLASYTANNRRLCRDRSQSVHSNVYK